MYLLFWVCIYSGGETGQNEILTFALNLTSPITTGTLTDVFCTFGPNLVILAWTDDELSRRQACDWYIHIDAGNGKKAKTGLGL